MLLLVVIASCILGLCIISCGICFTRQRQNKQKVNTTQSNLVYVFDVDDDWNFPKCAEECCV
jgi:hypothetical protein